MPKTSEKTTKPAPTLRLERTFDATPEQLWAAWTDPAQYAKWLNPAPGHDLVIHEWDLRVGGRVRFDMPQPDGNKNPQEGVFHQLDRPRELVSGSADRSFLIRALFEPVGRRTRLVVEVTGLPPEWHQPATVGWNQGFDKLERVLRDAAAMPSDREVLITRDFDAPPERVWAAWTDPERLARWFGPDGFRITTHAWDFRVGGTWRFTMHGPDGTDYPNWVRYKVIAPPRRLAYDHGGSKADAADFEGTATFEPLPGGRTRLALRSVFPSKEARDHVVREFHAIEGGRQTLARLAEHLAKQGA